MKYQVTHTTVYKASSRVSVCHNAAWLTPRTTSRQQVEQHEVTIDPRPSTFDTHEDAFGNTVTHFSFNKGYRVLRVTASSVVSVAPAPAVPSDSPAWETIVKRLQAHASADDLDALQYRFDSPRIHLTRDAAAFAEESFRPNRPILDAIVELTSRVYREFRYDAKSTTVTTPIAEVLHKRRGVCQDFAHAQIVMLRSLGLAARYVSGYVRTYPPPGQQRLVGADASHAWLSVYFGDMGWVDVDPTNDTLVGEEHITLGWGRDYGDVTPLKGVYTGGGRHSLEVSVDVTPIAEAPSR